MQFAIVIEKAAGSNYSAYVPDLPGCIATADTVDEIKRLMEMGIAIHLEGMREDGLTIPDRPRKPRTPIWPDSHLKRMRETRTRDLT